MARRDTVAESNPILMTLLNTEPPILESNHDPSLPASEIGFMTSITKLCDRELVYMINWAKQIPGQYLTVYAFNDIPGQLKRKSILDWIGGFLRHFVRPWVTGRL